MWGNLIGWRPVVWAVKEFTQGRAKEVEVSGLYLKGATGRAAEQRLSATRQGWRAAV